ncbi:MAG TPA: lysylphosphatidylglycerol synthase transmembrane domain-containing protein, partial [Ktedonobacteraceae bacterium]
MQQENQYDPDHRIRSAAPKDVQRIPTERESDSAEKQNEGIEDFSRQAALPPGEDVQKRHAILHGATFELNEEDYKFDEDQEQEISKQSKQDLIKLSGMVQTDNSSADGSQEEYWPKGIKQTGAVPVVNIYGTIPFGRTNPELPTVPPLPETPLSINVQPAWRRLLNSTTVRVILGLLIGVGLLFLISKIVNIPATIAILRVRLTTPQGIGFALLSGIAFLTAFSIRGVRWKLFLNPIGKVSTLKAIQLFLVGIFLNFLLPVRGGEVAKSLMLKRISNIPISQSLPTVAMDKALDLMPAL